MGDLVAAVGTCVGTCVGIVGACVGDTHPGGCCEVGDAVGANVYHPSSGCHAVGLAVGFCVGAVGVCVGATVGAFVGFDGLAVGVVVGDFVGAVVGPTDGAAVGGTGVGSTIHGFTPTVE